MRLLLPWRRDARPGSAAGLRLQDQLEASGEPRDYFLLPASRADPLRRAADRTAAPQARCQVLQLAGSRRASGFFAPAAGDGEQT